MAYPGLVSREERLPSESDDEIFETNLDSRCCRSGSDRPADSRARLRPELRPVLHPGRVCGISYDSGLEERDPDPYRSADFHDDRIILRLLPQTQSDQRRR